mgnify:FL=1
MSVGNTVDLRQVTNDDQLAREIATLWINWDTSRTDAKARWKETTSYVYATSTRDTTNEGVGGQDGAGWSHSTHLPKITQIYDNLAANYMAALMPHDDVVQFLGFSQDAVIKEQREKVEAYIKTKHRLSKFRTTLYQIINDLLLYGNCFAQVYYVNESSTISGIPELAYSGPKVRVISPYDIVFNPFATSFERSPKIVRSIKTLGEIIRDVEENPDGKYYAKGIKKWVKMRKAVASMETTDIDKYVNVGVDGFGTATSYFQSGNVEVLELYGDIFDQEKGELLKNHVITVVDRKYVIRKEPIGTWSGFPPIFHCGWRLRANNLWAMGPLDNLIGAQYLINHLENSRADAFDQMLFPTRVITGDVQEEGVQSGQPGGIYRIPTGEGSVTNLSPDTTVLQADMQISVKMAQMEEFVGSPKEVAGFRSPGEKTAFEVNSMLQSAGRIFQHRLNYFEEEFLERVYNAELEAAKVNLNKADLIRVYDTDDDVVLFEEIIPEDLNIFGKLIPTGARGYIRKQQLAQNLMSLQQAIQQDQMLATHFPSVKLADAWVELLDIRDLGVMEPWGRIREQSEGAKKTMLAQKSVEQTQAALGQLEQEQDQATNAEATILEAGSNKPTVPSSRG